MQSLFDWLEYPNRSAHEHSIADAHKDTFGWVFEQCNITGLIGWLMHGQGIFWISGAPGSGKSALMKYILRSKRLWDLSEKRTSTKPLIISSFWFCRNGSSGLQRSLTGLYRTLLCQILQTEPKLCRIAFPDWSHEDTAIEPTLLILMGALTRAIREKSISANHLFIIDGLDECETEGDNMLVEHLLEMAKRPNVKLLLSSRGLPSFEVKLQSYPTVRLETLKTPDIAAYVYAKIWSNSASQIMTKSKVLKITDLIVEESKGSFLVAVLAVADMMRSYDEIYSMKRLAENLSPGSMNHTEADDSGSDTSLDHNHRDTEDVTTYTRSEPTYESTLPTSVADKSSMRDVEEDRFSVYSFEYQQSLTPSQRDQLSRQFADHITSGLNIQSKEQCNKLLGATSRVNDLIRMFTLLRSSQAGKEGDLKATGFIRASRL